MKKLILTVAIVASGVSAFALPNTIVNNDKAVIMVMNDEFKEVAVDKLPAAVTSAVENDFASATISKAYVNTKKQYKLTLSIDESESTVYVDKDGKWLKEGDVAHTKM